MQTASPSTGSLKKSTKNNFTSEGDFENESDRQFDLYTIDQDKEILSQGGNPSGLKKPVAV
jgi:hypothetical protein